MNLFQIKLLTKLNFDNFSEDLDLLRDEMKSSEDL